MLMELADESGICFNAGSAERAFHHRLAVVELAVNRHGADIVLERRHQFALAHADFVNRKQHDDAHAGNVVKRVRHRRAGVAARRRENRHLPSVLAQKSSEHPRHHLRGEILERSRRPLIQPHQENAVVNFFQRDGEVVGITAHRGQIVVGNDFRRVNFDSTRKAIS